MNYSKNFKIKNRVHDLNLLGDIIKTSRISLGITQRELAKMAKTTQISVTRCETGQYGGGINAFYRLFKALNPPITIKLEHSTIYSKNLII